MRLHPAYLRSLDDAVMFEIAPHEYIGSKAAQALGLVTEKDVDAARSALTPVPASG